MAGQIGRLFKRGISSTGSVSSAIPSGSAVAGDHAGGIKLWRNLSLFVALPAVGLCMLNVYLAMQKHDLRHSRPEFKAYEHMRIRNKKFPWGDGNHSLFHNSDVNALPDGYED